jgi:hypothetical protein
MSGHPSKLLTRFFTILVALLLMRCGVKRPPLPQHAEDGPLSSFDSPAPDRPDHSEESEEPTP